MMASVGSSIRLRASTSPTQPGAHFHALTTADARRRRVLNHALKGVNRPPGDVWPTLPTRSVVEFEYSTVHGYTGLQAPAVILVVPKPFKVQEEDGVQQWCADEPGEARRVLYVGASRAQQLLVIAAHESVHDLVATTLTDDGVAIQLLS
ncbi:ATP-binding domain-containing protein (plasmid) [Rhodococcus pseudokoreensis]|uniref:ATP-binding domain-containing protein n=1 Tax=Rhodococcus pseudokoreensis TaxID=2811421 RepID=A0A974ZR34_9NOCA|nr:ATP-binding domain-containing protein [Rhodococcus pseudokoreensis]